MELNYFLELSLVVKTELKMKFLLAKIKYSVSQIGELQNFSLSLSHCLLTNQGVSH